MPYQVLGSGLLVVGLWLVVWPVLDALPLPGRSGESFFELWVFGIPLTWAGLRVFRRGGGRGPGRPRSRASPAGSAGPAVPRGQPEGAPGAEAPRLITAEELAQLDALYADRLWATLVEELRAIRRLVEAGAVVRVEGGPALETWKEFYEWAHGRYHRLEEGSDHWIGDDRS